MGARNAPAPLYGANIIVAWCLRKKLPSLKETKPGGGGLATAPAGKWVA